jgi:hypothetical protein
MRSALAIQVLWPIVRGPNRRVGASSSQLCVYRLVVLRNEGHVTHHAFEDVRLLFVRRAINKLHRPPAIRAGGILFHNLKMTAATIWFQPNSV